MEIQERETQSISAAERLLLYVIHKTHTTRGGVHKILYILDATGLVKTGYSFRVWIHGPFSEELTMDLDILTGEGKIERMEDGRLFTAPDMKLFEPENRAEIDAVLEFLDELTSGFKAEKLRTAAWLCFAVKEKRLLI